MRLKPAPKLRGWDSEADRQRYNRNRRRGRIVFVIIGFAAGWVRAPVLLAPQESESVLEERLREISVGFLPAKSCAASVVDNTRVCLPGALRAENARQSYDAALFGNRTHYRRPEHAALQNFTRCPRKPQRVVTEIDQLGGQLVEEVARDISTRSFAMIQGVLGQAESESTRRAGLVATVASLMMGNTIEGTSSTFRVAIPSRTSSWSERLREACLGPFADAQAVAVRLALDKLAAVIAISAHKLEPVAQAVFGRSALVETTLAVTLASDDDDVLAWEHPQDEVLTSTIALQDLNTISTLKPALPDDCVGHGFRAGASVFSRSVSLAFRGEGSVRLALRMSYVGLTSTGLPPSTGYVFDKDRVARYSKE